MFPEAHLYVVREGAKLADNQYSDILLENKFWIEKQMSAYFNDCVLMDWSYGSLPRCLYPMHRLTSVILNLSEKETEKLSFLLHWVCHYFADAVWTTHIIGRDNPYFLDRRTTFDNFIEGKVDEQIKAGVNLKPVDWNIGFWSSFWKVSSFSETNAIQYLKDWMDKSDYLSNPLRVVSLCSAISSDYFRYLGNRNKINLSRYKPAKGQVPSTVYFDESLREQALAILIWISLAYNKKPENVVASSPEEAGIVIRKSDGSPSIATEGKKIILSADEKLMGSVIDHYLFSAVAGFGYDLNGPHLQKWIGNFFLEKRMNEDNLKEIVFSGQLVQELIQKRGYRGVEVLFEPDKASPESVLDFNLNREESFKWCPRWRTIAVKL